MSKSGDEGIKNKFFRDLKRLFSQNQEVDDLAQDFENVGFKSNKTDTSSEEYKDFVSDGDDSIDNHTMQHPIRPDAEDCAFYIRTGTCKFGSTCKFNHPVLRSDLVGQGKSNENGVGSSWKIQIPCKFFPTGLCKYGESCRFNHDESEVEKSPPQLNVLGLPKRLGKEDCSFYLRTRMCGYGMSCRFHHPDPIFVSSDLTAESMDNHREASEIAGGLLYENHALSGYQEPPKIEQCAMNDAGLPVRPGEKVCWCYKYLGFCKLGHACPYDHPEKHSLTDGSTSESLSGGKTQETHK